MPENDARAIAEALAQRIEDLAELLVGEAPTYRSRTAIRFYPRGGLAVTVAGRERGLWCSHGDGGIGGDALDLVRHLRRCSTADALTWARDWLGHPEHHGAPERRPAAPAPRPVEPDSTDAARRLWTEAQPAAGTPAEAYLASRGLSLPPDAPLRFHAACRRGAETLPAMISLMTDPVTAEPCGVHRTFLRPDGRGKADGQAKMMLGRAGIIRLIPDDEVTLGLGIAEGIETSLAIMQRAGWSPVWACGSAGAIAKFPVVAGIETLTIFPDLDDKGAGIAAARQCAERWQTDGKEVAIAKPPHGRDWHDALTAREVA
jgi:hypothetical protein